MLLRYSSSVVAPMHWNAPRLMAGFSMLAASIEPAALPAPMRVCISSMKTMMSGFCCSSLMMQRRRSSNCPRYFVPATTLARSSTTRRFFQRVRLMRWPTMRCARPSTMALLPTPGSPMRMGLFFLRRFSICARRSISFSRPTTGSSSPSAAICVRSVPKLSSAGVLLSCFFCTRTGTTLPSNPAKTGSISSSSSSSFHPSPDA